jgi:hypothetical protein
MGIVFLYFSFPIYTIFKFKLLAVFNYFAADTFYYLAIAKKSVLLWNSADGSTHTNGFHPLWQNLLNLFYRLFHPSDPMFLYVVFGISFLFVLSGFLLLSDACRQISKSNISWLFMFPGMVYICGYQATTSEYGLSNIYQPFSFINGMESSLTILFFGILILVLRQKELSSPKDWFWVGCVVSLITISRLDDIFLVVGFGIFLLIFRRKNLYKNLLALFSPVCVSLILLFCYHLSTGQTLMPVSGSIKGTNTGEFDSNFTTLKRILRPGSALEAVNTRAYGLFIPLFLALVFLAIYCASQRVNDNEDRNSSIQLQSIAKYLVPFSIYVIIKSVYTFDRFYLIETGYWYYVGPVICVNFLAAILIGFFVDRGVPSRIFLLGTIGLIQVFNLSVTYQKLQTNNVMYTVFANRGTLQNDIERLFGTNVKVIDGTDGIYSFILNNPSQSARGFTINKSGYESFRRGGYAEYYNYLLKNDFGVLVGLDVYTHPIPDSITVIPKYRDEATGTVFSSLEKP